LKLRDVAHRLQVCEETARRLCMRGELPYLRIGNSIRIAEGDLVALLNRLRTSRA
jgi:excisionase family DNA binding protein